MVMAALYRSVTCPCSAISSCLFVAFVVAFIDSHVKISAITATRPGNAVTRICIQSRGGCGVTGRPGRAHLGRARLPVAERGARQNDRDDCPVRLGRLSGMYLSQLIGSCRGTTRSHAVTTFSTASRAHLRRAGPYGLDVEHKKRARLIAGEMSGQSGPP